MFNLNADDTGRFIYLFALLIFLASGFLFRGKIKTSEILKQLSLWFLIIMGIVILYSFRFEFMNIKNRLLAELFPSKAIQTGQNQITISLSQDNHYYINLKINNQNVRFMIDTGASDITLSQQDAKKIGINLDDLTYNKIYQTANGKTYGASVNLNKIELAGIIFYNIAASVNSSNMGSSLLGMSFLRNFKKYEFYQDKLILTY